MTPKYRMVYRDGVDTFHRWPAFEECNLDDTTEDQDISEDDGWDAVTGGTAQACEYCFPLPGAH